MSEPRKRPAFEPPDEIAAAEDARAPTRRPPATTAGAVLVLLRVVAGALWIVFAGQQWDTVLGQIDLEIAGGPTTATIDADAAYAVVATGGGAYLAAEALLAVLILRGWNLARVIVMLFAVGSVMTAFAGWWFGGQEVTLKTTLLTVSLDILILLALSSRSAAAYARTRQRRRRARRSSRLLSRAEGASAR